MPIAHVNDVDIAYELIGEGRPWVITPGGRFSKDDGGIRELAEALAAAGNQALIWDRPNCGASQVCFTGESESTMQADTLAALIDHLDLGPTVVIGGSGGARVSMLTAARHPELTAGLAMWWISGGPFGLMTPGRALLRPEPREGVDRGHARGRRAPRVGGERWPATRRTASASSTRTAPSSCARWSAGCSCTTRATTSSSPVSTTPTPRASRCPRWCSAAARATRGTRGRRRRRWPPVCPTPSIVEPPWGDREWLDRSAARLSGEGALFGRWPLLAEPLLAWAKEKGLD